MDIGNKIKAFSLALLIQTCIGGLILGGGILDPLIGLCVAGIYFIVIGSYLMYCYLLMNLFKTKNNF